MRPGYLVKFFWNVTENFRKSYYSENIMVRQVLKLNRNGNLLSYHLTYKNIYFCIEMFSDSIFF